METGRLVSKGYTNAEKAVGSNYAPGDVVAFHRPYKRLGVEKGDERRVADVDYRNRIVHLEGPDGKTVAWKPSQVGARKGGTEVYRAETIELRAGDRIRWTRNDAGLKLVNSGSAEVTGVRDGRVSFRLEDGRTIELGSSDPQLRHLDHAWASTVHAFQGRTVDNVIAAMEANHPNLTTAKAFYVEISRARDRAELVTDDAAALKERLEAVTGERISALEGIGESVRREHGKDAKATLDKDRPEDERQGSEGDGIRPEIVGAPVRGRRGDLGGPGLTVRRAVAVRLVVELDPVAGTTMISVEKRSLSSPSLRQRRVCILPSTWISRPFIACLASMSISPGWKVTTRCHSVRSTFWPDLSK